MSRIHRTVALCLLSSGQKTSVILELNVDFVTEQPEDRLNLWLDTERVKTGQDVITFFSKEATRRLRDYIKHQRKKAKPSDPLFVKKSGERMTTHAVEDAFRRAYRKLIGKKVKNNPFTPTRMRHIFESACRKAKLDPDTKKLFMGHKTSMSGEYNTDDIPELLEEYETVEPYLTVYEGTTSAELEAKISKASEMVVENAQEVDKLKAELAKTKEDLQTVIEAKAKEMLKVATESGLALLLNRIATRTKKEGYAFVDGLHALEAKLSSLSDEELDELVSKISEK